MQQTTPANEKADSPKFHSTATCCSRIGLRSRRTAGTSCSMSR